MIAEAAVRTGCKSVAFTYNDYIFLEYAVDVAQACRARGIKTVAVSAGYICPGPRRIFQSIDAANIDQKHLRNLSIGTSALATCSCSRDVDVFEARDRCLG